MKNTTGYEIWVLGYNPDGTVNDYEELIATFPEEQKDTAVWFMDNYPFPPKKYHKAVLEHVNYNEYGCSCCTDVIQETDI